MARARAKPKLYILWLAWRNLVSRSRKSGLSFMTVVSIFGAAVTEGEMAGIGATHPASGALDVEVRRPGIVLGDQLAEQLGAELGDEITVLSPQANVGTALGGGTVSRQYVVAGKFRTGLFN